MKCLLEGKQFITKQKFSWLHFIQNATLHLGKEVVPMPAKKKKATRKVAKRKPARKAVKKTTKKKAAKKRTVKKATSKKKKRK